MRKNWVYTHIGSIFTAKQGEWKVRRDRKMERTNTHTQKSKLENCWFYIHKMHKVVLLEWNDDGIFNGFTAVRLSNGFCYGSISDRNHKDLVFYMYAVTTKLLTTHTKIKLPCTRSIL